MDSLTRFLSSRVKAEVLRLLFGLEAEELHLRELARRAGLNTATVRQELKHLSELGLVKARKNGNRTYYRAENGHPLYPDIRNLVLKTSGLVDVLRQALSGADIRIAFVYGSLASGMEKAASDVDLMVIGSTSLRQLSDLLEGVDTRIGREINPHVLTSREFTARKKDKRHFLTAVLQAPKLFVIGNEDDLAEIG
jgi:DNA-binding transcriptional ArsR family regulator